MRSAMFFYILFLSALVSISGFALTTSSVKTSDLVNEAKSSFLKEDHFHAARLYAFAYEQSPKALDIEDIENYILSQSLLLKTSEFISFCGQPKTQQRAAEFNFYCGKNLVNQGLPVDGLKFLDNVPASFHRLEYHLIRSTAFLYSSKSQFCLDEIKKAQTKVSPNTSQHFRDLVNVTEARCLVDLQRFENALQKFQNIRVNSDFYLATLEEQAWVQFKMRNLASSRELLGIIISNIASQNKNDDFVAADTYFRVRYLQGYIDLVAQSAERSKQIFQTINQEIIKYKNQVVKRMQMAANVAKSLSGVQSQVDLDPKKLVAAFKFRNFSQTWGSTQQLNEFDSAIKLLIAINLELDRSQKNKLPTSYVSSLKTLKDKQTKYIAEVSKDQFNTAKRTIESIQFKSNMGQIENIWAERTEGKRTIAEALESYTKDIGSVEEYLGK